MNTSSENRVSRRPSIMMPLAWLPVTMLSLRINGVWPRTFGVGACTRCTVLASEAASDIFRALDREGNIMKRVVEQAPEEAVRPAANDFVTFTYTASLLDGTVVDDAHESDPVELQLTSHLTDGLHRGLTTMSEGEVAELRCGPSVAWSRDVELPPDETIQYKVQLVGMRDGPPLPEPGLEEIMGEEEAEALLKQFNALKDKGGDAAANPPRTTGAGDELIGDVSVRWFENNGEMTLWVSVDGSLRARDVNVQFTADTIRIEAGDVTLPKTPLRGRIEADESYWAFDDDEVAQREGGRVLQIVLTKVTRAMWHGLQSRASSPRPLPEETTN